MTSLWLVMSIIALGWPPGLLAQTSLNFVKYDVIICVDSSVTIGLDNFRALLKSVLTEYIETWPIGEDAVKVGVIAFSTTLEVISMTGNLTLLQQKVPLMYYEGRSTNTHLALDQANTMFISNGRTGVPKALILLTDGRARLPDKAFEYAQVLRNNSVSIWAIGVGTKYSLWELQQITANITRVNSTSTFSQLTPIDLGIPLVQVESSTTSVVIPPATTSTIVSSSVDTAATIISSSSVSTTMQPSTSPSVTSASTASSNTASLITTSDKAVSTASQSLDISTTATSQASLIAATSASATTSAPTSAPAPTSFTPTSSTPILFTSTSASSILASTTMTYNSIITSSSTIPTANIVATNSLTTSALPSPTSTTVPANSIGISSSTTPSSTTVPANSIGISSSTTPSSTTVPANSIGISSSTTPSSTTVPANSIGISSSTVPSSTTVPINSIGISASAIASSTIVPSNSNAFVTSSIPLATTIASSIRSSVSIIPTATTMSSNSIATSASPILTATSVSTNSLPYSASVIATSTTVLLSSFANSQSLQTSFANSQSLQTSFANSQSLQTSFANSQSLQTSFANSQYLQTSFAHSQSLQTSFANSQSLQTSFANSQSPQTSSSSLQPSQSSLNQQTSSLKASSLFPSPSTLLYSSSIPTQTSAYPPSPSYSVSQTTLLTHVSTSDWPVSSSWSIAPSKTTVPMSSSAIVTQPSPTTPSPRIVGDKSVSFNDTDLEAGLCLYADAKQGFGFAPHPQDCDKYIQCFLSDDRNVTASIRYCPRGLFWNQEKLTCVKPDGCNSITTCRDPCRYKFNGDTYRMDGGCGLYWECYKGVSYGRSCDPEEAYVPGRGCVYSPGCPHVTIRSTNCDDTCDARPLQDLSGYTTVLNLGAYKMACLYNTRFDIASCLCKPDHYFHEACQYTMKLDLRPRLSINRSLENNETSVAPSDTRTDAGPACNNICVDQKSRRPLALRFRYRRTPSPGAGKQREEVLIRSRECSSGGLFALTEDGETLKVRLISKKGQVVVSSLPLLGLNDTDWRQVRVDYSRGELTMSVSTGRLTYTSFNKGGVHIQVGVCGWLVGDPGDLVKNVGSYTGELQEVHLSRCFEYGQ